MAWLSGKNMKEVSADMRGELEMPNYVCNILRFNGNGWKKMLPFIKGEDTGFDFNTLVPMPEELNIESSGTMRLSFACELYRKEKKVLDILRQRSRTGMTMEQLLDQMEKGQETSPELGKKAYENYKRYGFTDWYDWCVHYWGTKWNAVSVESGEDYLQFETAWSAPIPVITALAQRFPDIGFTHIWADEDIGQNCGQVQYADGKPQEWYIPDAESSDAYDLYEECWGESDCIDVDGNGNKYCRSCENCDGCR